MNVQERLESLSPTDIGVDGPTAADMAKVFRSVRRDPLTFLSRVTRQYGDTVAFPVPGSPAVLFNDPHHVRQILQTSARNWSKQTVQYAALARVTGPGLLASAEPNWIEHRRLAAPAFHHHRLAAVGEQVRDAARDCFGETLGPRSDGDVVDFSDLMHRVALDAVGRALFSADLSTRTDDLLDATSSAAELIVRVGRSVVPSAQWTPTRTNLRLRRTRRTLAAICVDLIAARRARGADGDRGDDLLGLLLDGGLSDQEISDELITMVIAGHETVAAALSWTLMLLAEHPQVQQELRSELTGHDNPSMLSGRDELPWAHAVIDEALRLYPPAWALSRRSREEEVVGEITLPAGTLAIISPWILHRRGSDWTDAETFRPERFLGTAPPRQGYIPFGQGPRLCIGREFAIGEVVVVLAELLRDHRISLPDGWRRPAHQTRVAVHPSGGMPLRVDPIRSA